HELLAVGNKGGTKDDLIEALRKSEAQKKLRDLLKPRLKTLDYHGFVLIGPNSLILAADQNSPVGEWVTSFRKDFFEKVLHGKASVCKPYLSRVIQLADEHGVLRFGVPTMFAAAAIHDEQGKPVATLGLRIQPEQGFTKILQLARPGQSGETYAFDS